MVSTTAILADRFDCVLYIVHVGGVNYVIVDIVASYPDFLSSAGAWWADLQVEAS